MATLSKKQRAFVREYVIDRNGTQAAIRARYSKKTAAQQATRLLRKVHIQAALKELEEDHAEATEVSAEYITENLKKIADAGDTSSSRARALELLGRRVGYFKEDNNQKAPSFQILQNNPLIKKS